MLSLKDFNAKKINRNSLNSVSGGADPKKKKATTYTTMGTNNGGWDNVDSDGVTTFDCNCSTGKETP